MLDWTPSSRLKSLLAASVGRIYKTRISLRELEPIVLADTPTAKSFATPPFTAFGRTVLVRLGMWASLGVFEYDSREGCHSLEYREQKSNPRDEQSNYR